MASYQQHEDTSHNAFLGMTEVKNYNAETKEINHSRIERDHQDLQALTNISNSSINPFLPKVNQNSLFNLKPASNI